MRIVYLVESIGQTGGHIVLCRHMEALAREGHEVRLISPYGQTSWVAGTMNHSAKAHGYDGLWRLAKGVQRRLRGFYPALEKRAQRFFNGDALQHSAKITRRLVANWPGADITIATHSFTAHAAALLSNRTRAFYHIQGYEPWFSEDGEFRAIAELSYKLPVTKIANSQWLREQVQKVSTDEVRLVRPGLDHHVFYPRQEAAKRRAQRA